MTSGDLLPPEYLGGPPITGENCEREPIHIPGSVQPHGVLLSARADDLTIMQVSENAPAFFQQEAAALVGQPLSSLLAEADIQQLRAALPEGQPPQVQVRLTVNGPDGTPLALTAHRVDARLLIEVERPGGASGALTQQLRNALFALEHAGTLRELLQLAATNVQTLSGFDRVMIYRFAQDATGTVLAEVRPDDAHAYLDHRFPASDIPEQARALYVQYPLRLTADVDAAPAPLVPRLDPQTQTPTPLGGAVLRATSPMHVLYLRNMGVRSSLSVSIVVDGRLWGLIACHHGAAHVVPPDVRTALEYLARVLNLQVQLKDRQDIDRSRADLRAHHERLLAAAARTVTPLTALTDPALDLPGLLRAGGAVVFSESEWRAVGRVPDAPQVDALLAWLRQRNGTFLDTDHLSALWEGGRAAAHVASGLLAFSIGEGWKEGVLWVRPEVASVIAWGGAPPGMAKDALGPRRSFTTYLEQVLAHAEPWLAGELEEARAMQQTLTGTLGERLSAMKQLNRELEQAEREWRRYAFVIAHDLQEPLRLITQLAELFQRRHPELVDGQGHRLIELMASETARMRSQIDDLQHYTTLLTGERVRLQAVPLEPLLQRVLRALGALVQESGAQVHVESLPTVTGDPNLLTDALCQVLKNALTFTHDEPRVRVWAERAASAWLIHVQDEGMGVAPEYQERIFQIFQRLGRREDHEGNGVGLALARKIAELHGGTLTVTSDLGAGSTFTLTLPAEAE